MVASIVTLINRGAGKELPSAFVPVSALGVELTFASGTQLPTTLGQKTGANSLSIVPASDASFAITAAALPLPSGAATAAKQPALGTAGTPSADVITVQGVASGTPLFITGAVANDAVDSGNPIKNGGVANISAQTPVGDGDRVQAWYGRNGQATSLIVDNVGNQAALTTTGLDAQTNTINGLRAVSFGLGYNGSTWDRLRGDTAGLVTQPYALTGSRWQYAAAAGGISNTTTAVTIAAAAGGSLRNYTTSIQIDSTALGAATEIAIRDGAGGTVLWRGQIGTAGWVNGRNILFPVPLKGTANTLLEVVTLTASVTGAVYFNAQGFTAL